MKLSELVLLEKASRSAWVILHTEDHLILGRRSSFMNNPGQWNFFGGGIDAGEDARTAAVRELMEEARYSLKPAELNELATVDGATYFSAKVPGLAALRTTKETDKIRAFKLVDLPANLHSATARFFEKLELLLK